MILFNAIIFFLYCSVYECTKDIYHIFITYNNFFSSVKRYYRLCTSVKYVDNDNGESFW